MGSEMAYLIAADTLLIAHVLFVAFVILGLLLTLAGKVLGWPWVRNPWFRLAHVLGIGVVVLQAWLGVICPLTTWEMALRTKGGDTVYAGSFISHWLGQLLYYQAPEWVFIACYTMFGLMVAASWFWVRPRRFAKAGEH